MQITAKPQTGVTLAIFSSIASKANTKRYWLRICLLSICILGGVYTSLFLSGCAGKHIPPSDLGRPRPYKVLGKWYQPLENAHGYYERGIASWYGKEFHGRKTSSGEPYNMYAITAAHKTLPLGTYVRVHNLDNNKSVNVKINDRGPFVRGRLIDLSYGSAKKIGIVDSGTALVAITALDEQYEGREKDEGQEQYSRSLPDDQSQTEAYTVQLGAFRSRDNAIRLRNKLRRKYSDAATIECDSAQGRFYRVQVGAWATEESAKQYEQAFKEEGYDDAAVVSR